MATRYLIAAALLLGTTCMAQADVLPATGAGQSGYLAGWTTGNGTDVVSSGVLANGASLIGGVSYGNDKLAQALYAKASASLGAAGGTLSVANGIEGSYLVGMSNAKIAALLGNSVSVVGSGENITISNGQAGADMGGGGAGGGAGGTGGGAGGSGGGTGSTGGSGGGSTGSGAGGAGGDSGSGANGGTPIPVGTDPITGGGAIGGGTGGDVAADLPTDAPADTTPSAEVPEPSTLALLMAGVLGAAGIGRRRRIR